MVAMLVRRTTLSGVDAGVILVVVGLVAAGIATAVSNLRTRRAFEQQRQRSLQEARQEVGAQVSTMANEILGLTDRVALTEEVDPKARQLFGEATGTYQQAQDHLDRATTAPELEEVSDDLDRARWKIEAARALLEGREAPPEPAGEEACFFDPTHGAGTDVARIDTAAGQREVRVCSYCAAKLRSGRTPEPRMIEVGGRRVPAATAPRSYGGGGLEELGDFSLILDDVRRAYGWGHYGRVPGRRWRR
jgi:hypothetical protein